MTARERHLQTSLPYKALTAAKTIRHWQQDLKPTEILLVRGSPKKERLTTFHSFTIKNRVSKKLNPAT